MRTAALLIVVFSATACDSDDDVFDVSAVEPGVLAAETDAYSALVTVTDATGALLKPVHVNLMRDGRVLMIGVDGNAGLLTPSATTGTLRLAAATPAVEVTEQVFDDRFLVSDSLFCSGHTQLADGSFFSAGGTRFVVDLVDQFHYIFGLGYGTRFNGAWTRTDARLTIPGPSTEEGSRWYPQLTRLADGKVLISSGYDLPLFGPAGGPEVPGTRNVSAELYDPVARTFAPLTDAAHTPVAIFNSDYTHAFVLPYQSPVEAYVFGESSAPVLFGRTLPGTWAVRLTPRPGTTLFGDGTARVVAPSYGASSALLPIRVTNGEWGYFNGAALVAGGAFLTPNEHSIDVYDPIADRWRLPRLDMETRRHHPSTVVLPDGRVLVVAGHDDSGTSGIRVRKATYVDPANGFRLTEGSTASGEVRGYHTVSLLLPDGRVLVGGGRTAGASSPSDEKPTFRYYRPSYLFRPRPTLTAAPAVIGYGQSAPIAFTGGVREAVLIGLGSMTHSFDSNQRYVQLALTATSATSATVAGPPDPQTAPPGFYMLFAVDASRTPSVARIVQVR